MGITDEGWRDDVFQNCAWTARFQVPAHLHQITINEDTAGWSKISKTTTTIHE